MATELSTEGATLSGTSFENKETVIPESLKFQTTKSGIPTRRVPVKFQTEESRYATNSNRKIRVRIPNNAMYNFDACYATMDVTVTATPNGDPVAICQFIASIFNRLRIQWNAVEVEDVRDYNRIYNIIWKMLNVQMVTAAYGTSMGFGTLVQRQALSAVTTTYTVPIFSGLFSKGMLPMHVVPCGLMLELYLEDPQSVLETTPAAIAAGYVPVITVDHFEFHCERIELDDAYHTFIRNYVQANGLKLGFFAYERYINVIGNGTTFNPLINQRSSSLNSVINIFVQNLDIFNMAVVDRFINFPKLTLNTYNVLNNGRIFPDEPIIVNSTFANECWQIYCRYINKWKISGILPMHQPISSAEFNTFSFIFLADFEAYPDRPDLINPFTTLGNNAVLQEKLQFAAPVPNGYELNSWAEYFWQVNIRPKGLIEVSK